MSSETAPPSPKAFSYKAYRLFWFSTSAVRFAVQIISVAMGRQIYDLTRDPLYLGFVGLVQFLPALLLVLVTGLVADTYSRRAILAIGIFVEGICATALFIFALSDGFDIWPIYLSLLLLGTARAFMGPATNSLAPNLVPPEALASAITLNSAAWQFASIIGPVAGGILYGVSPIAAYGTSGVILFTASVVVMMIPKPPQAIATQAKSMDTMLAGFRYIWKEKLVLGAISLDLFAVFLGGAMALLPVYARDILEVGPWGLGMLRGAPAFGAIVAAIIMSRFPIRDHAGVILFWFVAAFGLFTMVFGVSTSVWVAVPALMMIGGCDMVSVVVRQTLLQLWTPDELRGRVSAVNSVFLGASNEVGEFRAGMVAAKWGTVFAVTVGGAGAILVAGLWSQLFPQLRKQRRMDRKMV